MVNSEVFESTFKIVKNEKLIFLFNIILVLGCSSDDADEQEIVQNPVAANLIFPFENSLCNVGTNITETEVQCCLSGKPVLIQIGMSEEASVDGA